MADLLLDALNEDIDDLSDLRPANVVGFRAIRPTRAVTVPEAPPAGDPMDTFLASVEHQAYRMARHALWDHELALDIVQDSMLKLVEHYRQKSVTEWPALFFTILQNRINDARRKRRVREGLGRIVSFFVHHEDTDASGETDLLDLGVGADLARPTDQPEDIAAGRRLRKSIDAAVRQLPERQRQVFLLREGQELSVRETSQILGCSEGTVKQHHFRAMQTLRHMLAEVWKND